MALAWSQIPHVSHQDVADVTELEELRQKHKDDIAEQGGSLTMTVFVIKAAVAALKAHTLDSTPAWISKPRRLF